MTERKSDGLSNEIGMNTRRGIKIQDGCDNDCSYCIVRIARGGASSVPAAAVAQQLRAAEAAGVREAVLTGVNIGAYHDQGAGLHLPELLEELLAGTDQLRIRLSSLEPQHASDRLLQLISASPGRVCAHLHLPLQSGSNHTLLAMRRRYDTAQFAERVSLARDLMPRLALTTDVIVGFPGERDQDFADSLEFCRSLRFSKVHVFRFSCRPQTEAAALAGQVDAATISKRAKAMRELAAQMRQQDQQRRLDTSEYVLVERRGRGTSESYHQVETPPDAVIGSLSLMRFVGCRDNLLLGSLAHSK